MEAERRQLEIEKEKIALEARKREIEEEEERIKVSQGRALPEFNMKLSRNLDSMSLYKTGVVEGPESGSRG